MFDDLFDIKKKQAAAKAAGPKSAAEKPAAPQPAGQERAEMYMVSELGKARYQIEHIALRDNFFRIPQATMGTVLEENGLYNLYRHAFGNLGIKFPYRPADFKVSGMKFEEDNLLVLMEMPQPEYSHLCYRIYLVSDAQCKHLEYYTIERGITGGFLCKWEHDQHNLLHELASPAWGEREGIMRAIEAKIIMDMFNGVDSSAKESPAKAAPHTSPAQAAPAKAAGAVTDIKAAIRECSENPGDLGRVMTLNKMFRERSFWVPMTISMSQEDQNQFLNAKAGDQVSLKDQARMKPDLLKDGGGNLFFPAFTEQEETDEQYRSRFSWVSLPGEQIVSAALNNESLKGIVINGFSKAFVLTREMLSLSNEELVQSHTIEKGSIVTFERIDNDPDGLKKTAAAVLKRLPAVKKAFFCRMFVDGKEESYCLVIDGDLPDPESTFASLNVLLAGKAGGHPLDFVMYPAMADQLRACGMAPFYASGTYKRKKDYVPLEDTRLFFMTTYTDNEGWDLGASFDFEKAEDSHYTISGDEAAGLADKLKKHLGVSENRLIVLVHEYLGDALKDPAGLESKVTGMLNAFDVKYDQIHFY